VAIKMYDLPERKLLEDSVPIAPPCPPRRFSTSAPPTSAARSSVNSWQRTTVVLRSSSMSASRAQLKTTVLLAYRTRRSRCKRTARPSTTRSRSRPFLIRSANGVAMRDAHDVLLDYRTASIIGVLLFCPIRCFVLRRASKATAEGQGQKPGDALAQARGNALTHRNLPCIATISPPQRKEPGSLSGITIGKFCFLGFAIEVPLCYSPL